MWENSAEVSGKWQDTQWKTCSEIRSAPRLQRCSLIPDLRSSHHKALHAHCITGWDMLESITLWKTVECSGKRWADYSSSPPDYHETTCQLITTPKRGKVEH